MSIDQGPRVIVICCRGYSKCVFVLLCDVQLGCNQPERKNSSCSATISQGWEGTSKTQRFSQLVVDLSVAFVLRVVAA